jgi:predicted AAA+ superfamily ATPase
MLARHITKMRQKILSQMPAVALLGARQAGKTTLAKPISKHINSICLDLESPEDLLKFSDPSSFLSTHSNKLRESLFVYH